MKGERRGRAGWAGRDRALRAWGCVLVVLLASAGCDTPAAPEAAGPPDWPLEDVMLADVKQRERAAAEPDLWDAVMQGDVEVARRLIKQGAGVNERWPVLGRDGEEQLSETYLCLAVEYGHTAMVRLLAQSGADVNKRSPLTEAAVRNRLEVAKILLDAGAHPNQPQHYWDDPMLEAATPLAFAG